MSTVAVVTAHKNDNEREERTMSLDEQIDKANAILTDLMNKTVVTSELCKRGYTKRISSFKKDNSDLKTIYYISTDFPYCLVELEMIVPAYDENEYQIYDLQRRFFIVDKTLAEELNFCKLQMEHDRRYVRLSSKKGFSTRAVHRLELETIGIEIKGLDVDHMTTNTAIMIRETLRTCTHDENIKNTRNTCKGRINTREQRVEIKVKEVERENMPILEEMGFHLETIGKTDYMVSQTLLEDEMYELAVKVSKVIDGEMGYNPFWDFGYEDGIEVFVNYKMLNTFPEKVMCLYNASVAKESDAVIWNYAKAMYRLYGEKAFKKPRCAFN